MRLVAHEFTERSEPAALFHIASIFLLGILFIQMLVNHSVSTSILSTISVLIPRQSSFSLSAS
jgi:hypothetical protein